MPPFTPRAFDDRGREVTYLDPMTYGSQLDRATRERLNRRKDPSLRQLLLFGAIIVVGLVPQILRLLSGSFPAAVAHIALTVALAAIAWFLVLLPVRRARWSRSWKQRYKDAAHCPACQYNMQSLPAEPDGCTVCPECGGAWSLPQPDRIPST